MSFPFISFLPRRQSKKINPNFRAYIYFFFVILIFFSIILNPNPIPPKKKQNMDDFNVTNLHASRDEWCARLVSILTPLIIEGIKSIFNEAWKLANDNGESGNYLKVFQSLLERVPKWNATMIDEEKQRIMEKSGCGYLEDLITCVHIIQLKTLTCIRVGNKQKKIDITIPKLDLFLHKVYVHLARRCYKFAYLFQCVNIKAVDVQKNKRELELIAQESILAAIRESIPTEQIIKAYLDESMEQEEEVIIEPIPDSDDLNKDNDEEGIGDANSDANTNGDANGEGEDKPPYEMPKEDGPPAMIPAISDLHPNEGPTLTRLTFNDVDKAIDIDNQESAVVAPKDVDSLERISEARHLQRKMEEGDEDDDGEDNERIQIGEDVSLDDLGILDMGSSKGTSGGGSNDLDILFDELPPL